MLHALANYKDYGAVRVRYVIDTAGMVTVTIMKLAGSMYEPVTTYTTDYERLAYLFSEITDMKGQLAAEHESNR